MKRAWSIGCLVILLAAAPDAQGQQRPLAQQLLLVDDRDTTRAGPVNPADSSTQPLEPVTATTLNGATIDSTATDYVSPDVGPPGSQRKAQEEMRDPPPQKRSRSGARIGIGLPIGFFFML